MAVNIRQDVAENLKVGVGVLYDYEPGKRIAGAVEVFTPTGLRENGLCIYHLHIRSAGRPVEVLHQFRVRADQPITIITEG